MGSILCPPSLSFSFLSLHCAHSPAFLPAQSRVRTAHSTVGLNLPACVKRASAYSAREFGVLGNKQKKKRKGTTKTKASFVLPRNSPTFGLTEVFALHRDEISVLEALAQQRVQVRLLAVLTGSCRHNDLFGHGGAVYGRNGIVCEACQFVQEIMLLMFRPISVNICWTQKRESTAEHEKMRALRYAFLCYRIEI